ncbi:MAG TPA: sarcosine oxidase subunit delta [Rhizobiales bacterium]|nr:sarcosine oxidase subunit delta [Hyphomicrobiales bacterium]
MLLIRCPVCGVEGEEGDFHAGGQAHITRPATIDPDHVSDEQQRDYLFWRFNPKGLHFERWRCDRGCGKWFHAARDTVSNEFKATYPITQLPPLDLMKQATGPWAAFFAGKIKELEKKS